MRALLVLGFVLYACQADPLDLENRGCASNGDCVSGYSCDVRRNVCVRGLDASSGSGGMAGMTPSGGSSGDAAAGSGGSSDAADAGESGGASGAAGACADIASDPENCGACGRSCSTDGVGVRVCSGGLCVSSCELGFANCSTPAAPAADDGCETDATLSADCGGCANQCSAQGAAGGFSCEKNPDPVCGCGGDDTHCGGGAAGKCEASGLCSCGGSTCRAGEACKKNGSTTDCSCNGGAACSGSESCCQTPSGCRDLQTDLENCGACGRACAPGAACEQGNCV